MLFLDKDRTMDNVKNIISVPHHEGLQCTEESLYCERVQQKWKFCGSSAEKILYGVCFMQWTSVGAVWQKVMLDAQPYMHQMW
jgi:hypothetical protein